MKKNSLLLMALAATGGLASTPLPEQFSFGKRHQYLVSTSSKPWLNALEAKCKQGATSPSIDTRQSRRAGARAADWAQHRMEQTRVKVGRQLVMELRNKSGLTGPRRERRGALTMRLTINA